MPETVEAIQSAALRAEPVDAERTHAVVRDTRDTLRGRTIRPGDPGYDVARAVWNSRVDRRPAVIVHAEDIADIAAAVAMAREQGLLLAVRSGGHHPAGHGVVDGGLVLDVSALRSLHVDEASRTARVGAGVRAGEFFRAIHARGLVTTIGSHTTVGLTGLTLGGGIGLLMGRYGLACDNLVSAEVVTADGQLHTASATENPDLYWALRGGGGNFGVVAAMTLQLHPIERTMCGVVAHPIERTADVLRFFGDYTADLPDGVGALAVLLTTPQGMPVCAAMVCHTGPAPEGERLLRPLKEFGPPVLDTVQQAPYTALVDFLENADPAGHRYAYANRWLPALTDEAVDVIADHGTRMTSAGSAVVVYHQHGAAARVPADATAFAARGVPYNVGIYPGWTGGDDAPHLQWLADLRADLEPHTCGTSYLNLACDANDEDVRAAYGANYPRLAATKRAWDPENLFRHCANVQPAA